MAAIVRSFSGRTLSQCLSLRYHCCLSLTCRNISQQADSSDDVYRQTIQNCIDALFHVRKSPKDFKSSDVSPLRLKFCDAYRNTPFPEAVVVYDDEHALQEQKLLFVSNYDLFSEPKHLLEDFLNGRTLDLSESKQAVFQRTVHCLHTYLTQANQPSDGTDFEPNHALCLKQEPNCEGAAQFLLGEHLYSRLVPDGQYILNQVGWSGNTIQVPCPCRRCLASKTPEQFALGNADLWHGHPDILVSLYNIPVTVSNEVGPEQEIENGNTVLQFDSEDYSDTEVMLTYPLDHPKVYPQSVATTIVNSFLMSKKFGLENFLVPCFVSTLKTVAIYFYDCDNDILLRTVRELPIRDRRDNDKLDNATIFFLWLNLNCLLFQPKLSESEICWLKTNQQQANFHQLVGKKLKNYRDSLDLKHGSGMFSSSENRRETISRLMASFPELTRLKLKKMAESHCQNSSKTF